MAVFLTWFEESRHDPALDSLRRAGIAHFWFVTLHPFEDGNGRLARAITDRALAEADRQSIRRYTMLAANGASMGHQRRPVPEGRQG